MRETILEQENMLNMLQASRANAMRKSKQMLSESNMMLAEKEKQLAELLDLCKKLTNT